MLIEKILIGIIIVIALALKFAGLDEPATYKIGMVLLSLKVLLLLIYTYLSREHRFVLFTGLYLMAAVVSLLVATKGNFGTKVYFQALPPVAYALFIFYRIFIRKTDYKKLTYLMGILGIVLFTKGVFIAFGVYFNMIVVNLFGYFPAIISGTLILNQAFASKLLRVEKYLLTYLLMEGVLLMIAMIN